jgi:hypothetical protein
VKEGSWWMARLLEGPDCNGRELIGSAMPVLRIAALTDMSILAKSLELP